MTIYAPDVDYWKTGSKRSAVQWIDLAVKQLRDHGATDVMQAIGEQNGREAFLLQFLLAGQRFRILWEVLPLPLKMQSEADQRAARVQAATSLYHDVKARCVAAARYGGEMGFFQFKVLPDGRTVQQLTDAELTERYSTMLPGPDQKRIL